MLAQLKADLKKAMMEKDIGRRDILRVLIGELQVIEARNQPINEEKVYSVIKKLIASNEETASYEAQRHGDIDWNCNRMKLHMENQILSAYLPRYWSVQEIEAFFLNSDGPEIEQIQESAGTGAAMAIAMKTLKKANAPIQGVDVTAFVAKVRENL